MVATPLIARMGSIRKPNKTSNKLQGCTYLLGIKITLS
jgi:hypothetical protein